MDLCARWGERMTYIQFCARYFIPFPEARAFRVWLGDDKNAVLTEEEWKGLWLEFQELIPNSVN